MANKKDINKRRNKAAQKKQAKRKAKAKALRRQADIQVVHRPGISEMEVPEGFRAIGMAQAMMEYAKPFDEYLGPQQKNGMDDLNNLMNLSMMLWNHALDEEKGEEHSAQKKKHEVVKALSDAFGLTSEDAEALRVKMVERHRWLFPEEVQPKERLSPFMIMRKETRADIKPFAYDRLRHTNYEIPVDADDLALIENIKKLDRFMEEEADYDEYEELLSETKDKAEKQYGKWFEDRGFPEEFHDLPYCIDIYFDFVYGYLHDHVVTLKTITLSYLTEFFDDFLIRKFYVTDPQEYTKWPPAIKLFYLFLKDKGYMESIDSVTSLINVLELRLMEVLRKQFG